MEHGRHATEEFVLINSEPVTLRVEMSKDLQ